MLEPREELRVTLLKEWEQKWLSTVSSTQHLINKSVLNSEELDYMWYKLGKEVGEKLIDSGVAKCSGDNNRIECEVLVIREKE
jgi:hypothetical protein